MAAGRNGGYHDNGYRKRDSEFETMRRDYESSRNDGRNGEKVRVQEAGDRIRVRRIRGDSGGSGRGGSRWPRRCGFSLKVVDKEPGELSSESGSEDAMESESVVKNSDVAKAMVDWAQSLVGKKRKFSPIVWDIDDKELSSASKKTSPVRESKNNKSQSPSPIASAAEIVGYAALESPVDLDLSPPKEEVNNQDAGQLEDEDYVLIRHISSSRWASGGSSPGDEGEILEGEEMAKTWKKLPLSESAHKRSGNKSTTPELGELNREGSEGNYSDGFMEIDVGRDRNDSSVRESDTDSENENENDSPGTSEPSAPPLRSVNMLQGFRSVDEFERLNKIDEGTYGVVYRARDKKTGEIVALKKVKMEKQREGFPLTSLREINILLSFHHPSIVDVKVVVGSSLDSIFMVMEHDLKALMETMKQPFSQSEVKCLMLQLLEGVKYLHDKWVLHRDLKTSNLLLNNQGELKICDFGLTRQYGSPLKPYTHLVVTLWYSLPYVWLINYLQRITAEDALNHMWFCEVSLPKTKAFMPTFLAQHAQDRYWATETRRHHKYCFIFALMMILVGEIVCLYVCADDLQVNLISSFVHDMKMHFALIALQHVAYQPFFF
ncbi:hypothetical protein GQ457_06G000890 [Hibiscus cannabinus]